MVFILLEGVFIGKEDKGNNIDFKLPSTFGKNLIRSNFMKVITFYWVIYYWKSFIPKLYTNILMKKKMV